LTNGSRDIYGWYQQTQPSSFLPDEDIRARAWLTKMGWQEGDRFVCLLVRDSAYLDNTYQNTDCRNPGGVEFNPKNGYGWKHLDYRDSDIATYVPAAEWLADQGVWVIRMGKIMAKPIPTSHPRIVDYAFSPDKSDFLDIWLFAHCDFCISTGTGLDVLCDIYRKPILFLNFMPLLSLWSWSNAMHLTKTLVWKKSGIKLNLRENIDCYSLEYYDQAGIEIIDLTPEEILVSVQELWERMKGTWVDSKEDIQLQNRFWELLKTHPDYHKLHHWIHPQARAGATWLRNHGEDFFS